MFKNFKIRNKLVFIQVINITISSFLVGFGIYYLQLQAIKDKKLDETKAIARIVSYNVMPAMEFLDNKVAEDVLKTIKDVSDIEEIVLKQNDGKVFAQYQKSEIGEKVIHYPEYGSEPIEQIFTDKYLFSKFEIVDGGKKVGLLTIRSNLSELEETKKQFITVTVVGVLCIIILSFVIILFTQGAITKPIDELLQGVRNISETKDYRLRVSKYGNDEIGVLTERFNNLIGIVEKQNNILSEDNKKLDSLVKQRTQELEDANEKLEEHLDELEETNKELSKFVYIVSHDLKAPLRAISSLSSFIEEDLGEDVDEDIVSNLMLIRQRTMRMENLIEGLLQYSKSGKKIKNKTEYNLSDMYSELQGIFNDKKSYSINYNLNEDCIIYADRMMMQQVFQNLIQNAIKYNDKDVAKIEIDFELNDDFYTFEVKDNGIGIDPEYQNQIFEVFKTLHARDEVEGTGIGLSIVKRIVEDNGGKISVESKAGEGSTFKFTWKK